MLGLARGESFDTLFITGVALAVAAIPTGLPAVVTALLSMGTREIARRNAIVKRLPAVETLGSTSAICSDKTGTLTLNKMTARELVIPGQNRYTVSGEGYSTAGEISHVGGERHDLDPYLLPMVLCADAVLDGEALIGDPTEGALIVLGAKGGLDIDETRKALPRVAEVPFDSDYKFMATFHEMTADDGRPVVRCYVKGAPDVLIARATTIRNPDGTLVPITDDNRHLALEANDQIANAGERVMVVAQRDFEPGTVQPGGDLIDAVHELTLLAMVGIVDPPRPEARTAIAECREAGIRVRMITGDHAATAAAIAGELGIEGRAVTGTQFAAMSDEQLLSELDEIGVVARVAPEDKVRLVRLLKEKGNVVAMTGDGVNDAPALKTADIGVAMGITGTEVSKEAAVMILTDDNFATIVSAVSYGRTLYDNLLKYLRFQMSTLVAYIAIFIGAGTIGIANGAPLNPLQILWLNMVVDIPLAIALGFDQPARGVMSRRPRPLGAPVLSRNNWIRLCALGAVMTIGSLIAYQIGDDQDGAVVAATMLLTTLSLFHVAAALLCRDEVNTIFDRSAIPEITQLRRYGIALLAIILVTSLDFLQRIFDTTALTFTQWCICTGIAASIVVVEELIKLVLRRRAPAPQAAASRTAGGGRRPPPDAVTMSPGARPPALGWRRPTRITDRLAATRERGGTDDDVHGMEVRGHRGSEARCQGDQGGRTRRPGQDRRPRDHVLAGRCQQAQGQARARLHHARRRLGSPVGRPLRSALPGARRRRCGGRCDRRPGQVDRRRRHHQGGPHEDPHRGRPRHVGVVRGHRAGRSRPSGRTLPRRQGEADLHEPHRGRAGHAAGDLRRDLTRARGHGRRTGPRSVRCGCLQALGSTTVHGSPRSARSEKPCVGVRAEPGSARGRRTWSTPRCPTLSLERCPGRSVGRGTGRRPHARWRRAGTRTSRRASPRRGPSPRRPRPFRGRRAGGTPRPRR